MKKLGLFAVLCLATACVSKGDLEQAMADLESRQDEKQAKFEAALNEKVDELIAQQDRFKDAQRSRKQVLRRMIDALQQELEALE